MLREIFSSRVRQLRKAAGLTQTQLAEALGLTRHNIDCFENSRTVARAENILILANFFNVTIDYLFGRSDDPHKNDLKSADEKTA